MKRKEKPDQEKKNRTKKGIPGLTRRTRRKKTISGKDFFFSKRFLFVVFRFDWYSGGSSVDWNLTPRFSERLMTLS